MDDTIVTKYVVLKCLGMVRTLGRTKRKNYWWSWTILFMFLVGRYLSAFFQRVLGKWCTVDLHVELYQLI